MNDVRTMLADTAARLHADLVTPDVLERAEGGEFPDALWTAFEENGFTRVLVPEGDGGVGGSWEDAFVLLHAAGRWAAPVPLAETIVAAWLLTRAGLDVPSGVLTIAPARGGETLRLVRRDAHLSLDGEVTGIPWGRRAEHLVAVASGDDGPHLVVVSTRDAGGVAGRNIADEPRDSLRFSGAPVLGIARCDVDLRLYGALVRAVQLAGGISRLLELSVTYAGERSQFGRPIAAFQAVQHLLAVLAEQAAAGRMAAETACRAADRGDATFEIAVAKLRAGEAAAAAATIAHEVHGAIGFTHEHALHFTTRRLWAWRAEFGAESHWARALGRDALARGADALWPSITARD